MAGEILKLRKSMSKQPGHSHPEPRSRADGDAREQVEDSPHKGETQLDGGVQAHIGRLLKASYDEMLNQPLPDRLVELLEELDKRERNA